MKVGKTDIYNIMMLTCPFHVNPLTTHFYKVKMGLIGVYITFLFFLKHKLGVLVRTASLNVPTIYVLTKNKRKYHNYSSENHRFYSSEISQFITQKCYLNVLLAHHFVLTYFFSPFKRLFTRYITVSH